MSAATALATAAARNLATTTKSVPLTAEISPRWLLRMLPWVNVDGATYRVNRRLSYQIGDGQVTFLTTGAQVQVVPEELRELPLLRGLDDVAALRAMADRFVQRDFAAGETLARRGELSDQAVLLARGRAQVLGPGEYGAETVRDTIGSGDHFGDRTLIDPQSRWEHTVTALTPGTVLILAQAAFDELVSSSEPLRAHLAWVRANPPPAHTRHGEAMIDLAAGHRGEADLPGTFVDYDAAPRELALSLAQTVVRIHTRVTDLYDDRTPARGRRPIEQREQQLRVTVEMLRERQEHELVNNRDFGLMHNADLTQRFHPRTGPPTPDELDRLLTRRRSPHFFLAHPRAIAAIGRECTRRGLCPGTAEVAGSGAPAWRGVPILPCDKIPVTADNTSSILVLRTGPELQGVVGLRQTGLPDEREPGLSVRFRGVSNQGIASYLVSAYYSLAVLVPDALGILESVDIGQPTEEI